MAFCVPQVFAKLLLSKSRKIRSLLVLNSLTKGSVFCGLIIIFRRKTTDSILPEFDKYRY